MQIIIIINVYITFVFSLTNSNDLMSRNAPIPLPIPRERFNNYVEEYKRACMYKELLVCKAE